MKRLAKAVLTFSLLTAAISPALVANAATVTPAEQQKINVVIGKFMKEYGISADYLGTPFLFDITNDGIKDIIVTSENEPLTDDTKPVVLAVYSYNSLQKVAAKVFSKAKEETYLGEQTIFQPVRNPKYKNVVSLTHGYRDSTNDLYVLSNGQFVKFATLVSHTGGVFEDKDNDGFHEYISQTIDDANFINMADGPYLLHRWKWDINTNKYVSTYIGKNIGDKFYPAPPPAPVAQKPIAVMNQEQTFQFVTKAIEAQFKMGSYEAPLATKEDAAKILAPYFTQRFIQDFTSNGLFFLPANGNYAKSGWMATYLASDDWAYLIPDITRDGKTKVTYSADKKTIYVTKIGYTDFEGNPYPYNTVTTIIATNVGWRIDSTKLVKQ